MDDKDKNVIEQIVDKINDVVETVATVAADALSQAMEPDPVKSDQQPISEPPIPFTVMPVHAPTKKPRAKKAVAAKSTINVSGRITPTYEFPAPDSTTMPVSIPTKKTKKDARKKKSQKTVKKSVKKSAKKVAMKSPARKSTKAAQKATNKTTKMVARKRRAKKGETVVAVQKQNPEQKPPSKRSRQILLPHNASRSDVRPEQFEPPGASGRRNRPRSSVAG